MALREYLYLGKLVGGREQGAEFLTRTESTCRGVCLWNARGGVTPHSNHTGLVHYIQEGSIKEDRINTHTSFFFWGGGGGVGGEGRREGRL